MNKFRYQWKKNILISFLLIVYSSGTNAELQTTIIKSCYDGDTCTTSRGEKIRLACIDTPELKGKKADPIAAKEARDFLNKLVINKEVSIRRITKDRYGRTVAELFKNNINIQKLLVDKGYGQIYKKYSNQCEWSK
tara:strand:+ start:132 stop:539 length:408 start_codon:yes stop_codon:yes gene_type:complete